MMKAWRLTKPGIDNLELTSIPIPEDIKPYEVAIKLLSSSLNPVDWKKCDWEGGPFKISYPCGCGLDGCGVVVRLGDSVDKAKFEINKTIVFFHGSLANSYGSFAEYTTHDSRYLSIVPQETIEKSQNIQVLAHELSALCCAGFTAYQVIFSKLRLTLHQHRNPMNKRKVNNIFVTAGAGGVGGFTLQLLKYWRSSYPQDEQEEIRIITSCSSRNIEFVKQLGATHVVDYNDQDLVKRVIEITNGRGVNAWIDMIDKNTVEQGIQCLAYAGEIVVITENSDYKDKTFARQYTIHNVSLGTAYALGDEVNKNEIKEIGDEMFQLYCQNIFKTKIQVQKLDDAKHWLLENKKGHTQGKIVFET